MSYTPTPERTHIRSVLINGMCDFEDGTSSRSGGEPMSAELVAHSFGVYLLTVCVFSKTEHEPQGGEPRERRT